MKGKNLTESEFPPPALDLTELEPVLKYKLCCVYLRFVSWYYGTHMDSEMHL